MADAYKDRRELRRQPVRRQGVRRLPRDPRTRKDIDAVVVATPDHWHVPIAIMAARAGKDCYVEKPLGLSAEQDLALPQGLHRAQPRLPVRHPAAQLGALPHRLRARAAAGRIGKIRALEVVAPNGGSGGSTQEAPVPPGFDYEMWLGPAPAKPYTVDRCKPQGHILDLRPVDRLPRRLGRRTRSICWSGAATPTSPAPGPSRAPARSPRPASTTRCTTGT